MASPVQIGEDHVCFVLGQIRLGIIDDQKTAVLGHGAGCQKIYSAREKLDFFSMDVTDSESCDSPWLPV